jgi:hypothetical protein
MSKARKNPASRARATVWTTERVDAVCVRHAAGAFLKHACALEGGTYDGLIDAMASSPEIAARVEKAHAEGVELLRKRKDSAMPGDDDWKKYAWDLERFDREAFAPPTSKLESKNEHTGRDGAPIAVRSITPAEAKAELAERLAAMSPEDRALAERLLK